jgi:uracil-DNA glycosylase
MCTREGTKCFAFAARAEITRSRKGFRKWTKKSITPGLGGNPNTQITYVSEQPYRNEHK